MAEHDAPAGGENPNDDSADDAVEMDSGIRDMLLNVEAQLEEQGWDRPARLDVLHGLDQKSGILESFVELDGHPCDALHSMWQDGVRVPQGAVGLVMVVEGWRMIRLDELQERVPDTYEQMRGFAVEASEKLGIDANDPDAVTAAMKQAWNQVVAGTRPSTAPENLRVEVRNAMLVTNVGWTFSVARDRGGEPIVGDPLPPQQVHKGRVPHFMWQFLNNIEPTDSEN